MARVKVESYMPITCLSVRDRATWARMARWKHRRRTRPQFSFRIPRIFQSEAHSRARARAFSYERTRQASPREPDTSKITPRRHSVTLCPNRRSLIAKPSCAARRGRKIRRICEYLAETAKVANKRKEGEPPSSKRRRLVLVD